LSLKGKKRGRGSWGELRAATLLNGKLVKPYQRGKSEEKGPRRKIYKSEESHEKTVQPGGRS